MPFCRGSKRLPTSTEPGAEAFFASRGGVCVYVKVHDHNFRVQFATVDAHGTVSPDEQRGADQALEVARAALREHRHALGDLFDKVARART